MRDTLCWSCRVPGTGGCSWDKSLTPVDGWDADRMDYRDSNRPPHYSYHVRNCPLYQPESYSEGQGGRGLSTPLSEAKLEQYLFFGFSDREIARRTGLAATSVARRRRDFMRKRPNFQKFKEDEQ